MSAAVDANVLIYACHDGHPNATKAREVIDRTSSGGVLFIPWLAVFAFLRVSTHPRIWAEPLTPDQAMTNVERLLALPGVRTVGESDRHWRSYRAATEGLHVRGGLVSDAHLASVLLANGIRVLYTNDADFRRFDFLEVRNPFR